MQGKPTNLITRSLIRVITSENIDLYVLATTALGFTVLGFLNVLGAASLSAAILALLALLATSQIRSRHGISKIANEKVVDPLALLGDAFPDDFEITRSNASDFLFIGQSMVITVQTMKADLLRILRAGGSVRVLLLNPLDDSLLRSADTQGLDLLRGRIRGTLDELESMQNRSNGRLEIRVCSFVPKMCVHAFDLGSPRGVIILQHYEYQGQTNELPIIRLNAADGFWYEHFTKEAVRMWNSGVRWPLPIGQSIALAPRPLFKKDLRPELVDAMSGASSLLITGVTRNNLVRENYKLLERLLLEGCVIRFVLVAPAEAAIESVSERYYAARSHSRTAERVQNTLEILDELKKSTGGSIAVRLSSYPIAMGVVAVGVGTDPGTAAGAVFAEYYSYQAPGEAMFALGPADSPWLEHFVAEAELLWKAGHSHPLGVEGTEQVAPT